MMKTKNIIQVLVLSVLVLFTSCDKYLDFEPTTSIDFDKVFVDAEGMRSALDGAYAILGSSDFFAGTSIFHSDLVGANSNTYVNWQGTFIGYRQMFRKSLDPTEGTLTTKWTQAYRTINICNNILANLNLIDDADERAAIEGEAKFIRGVLYFELVRFYAQPYGFAAGNSHVGVPLITTATNLYDEVTNPSRASVADVYTLILSDLNTAKLNLDPGKAGSNRGLATSTVASAFLARVYLSMKSWANAANEATTVINEFGGATALNSTPRACYNNTNYSTEDVFMVRQNLTSHAGSANDGIGTFFASLPGFGRGDVQIQDAHLALFEATDLRGTYQYKADARSIADISAMYYRGIGSRAGATRCSKWGKYDAFINVIRLAEMFLTRAEANFMNSSAIGDTPRNDLNVVRARANASLIANDADVNMDLIKLDRYKELCFEGHELHDLKRWQGSVVAPAGSPWVGQTLQWNDGRLVYPIPQREMDVNKNLQQNPAYIN